MRQNLKEPLGFWLNDGLCTCGNGVFDGQAIVCHRRLQAIHLEASGEWNGSSKESFPNPQQSMRETFRSARNATTGRSLEAGRASVTRAHQQAGRVGGAAWCARQRAERQPPAQLESRSGARWRTWQRSPLLATCVPPARQHMQPWRCPRAASQRTIA